MKLGGKKPATPEPIESSTESPKPMNLKEMKRLGSMKKKQQEADLNVEIFAPTKPGQIDNSKVIITALFIG